MILKKMWIENFKSFSKVQEFNFGNEKGVYFLSGNNKVDELLGSNGAGKSSIWDALCWVLYGKTVRGVKAGDLLTWFSDKKGFSVELEWERNNTLYRIRRTWNPNKILLSLVGDSVQEVDQQRVDEVFGIPYTPFLFSIVMGQARPMFFDLKEANRATLFSEVFMLDKWIDLSEKASSDTKELEILGNKVLSSADNNKEEIKGLKRELCNLKKLKVGWSAEKKKRIGIVNKKIGVVNKELKSTNKKLKAQKKDKCLIELDLKTIMEEMKEFSGIICKIDDRIKAVEDEMVQDKSHINVKKEDEKYFRKFSKGGNSPCLLCRQPIKAQYATEQIKEVRKKIRKLGLKYHDKVLEKRTWKDNLEKTKIELEGLEKEATDLSNDLGGVNKDISFFKGVISSLDREKSSYEKDIKIIQNEASPFSKSIRNINTDIYLARIELLKLKRIYKAVIEKKELTSFWIKGFKDIRLYMVSEFLIQLEIEVNNALGKLGLPEWKISFDIEKETKSKTIRKGFHVLIHSPFNENTVPWELWSGGESQRLRLAGNMGLSSLILSQYGISPNIEIWDEPSSHLNKESGGDLLDTFYERAQLLNKCIWIVEHNALDYGNFVKTVEIVKTKNGSIINN